MEPGQCLQVTSSSTGTAVLEPGLISHIQHIKVLEPVFEELAVSSQTRNSRSEGERKKPKPVSVILHSGALL